MATVTSRLVFNGAILPEGQTRWGFFSAGIGLECAAITALVIIPLLMPQKLQLINKYWTTPIAAPVIEAWKPQPPPPPEKPAPVKRVVVKKEIPKPEVVEPPKPKIISPVFNSPVAKPATAKKNTPRPNLPDVAKTFPSATPAPNSMGNSAIPTIKKPREEVQTGGFGDPNGVPANAASAGHSPNINVKGAFDLPVGPGYGNGTGGAKGSRGVVASTGFGNGVAQPGNGGSGHGSVIQGLFGDESPAAAAPKPKPVAALAGNTKPVEILFKPKPAYTDEARAKKIEGEVLLQVVFLASGDVQVQRVFQGLGYGLDESAQFAARQIKFHPAMQGGQPVDFPAVVHIIFQLAY